MSDSQLTQSLKQTAASAGADLVGIAPVARFDEVAPQHHPASIYPETKSVVALAKRIARGCLRGTEEGTQLSIYPTYACNWVPHRFLAYATVGVASFLEDSRYEAVPLPDLPPETPPMGVPVRGTVLSLVSPRGMRRYGYGADYGTYGGSGYYEA